jgi:hypothetical protein
MTMFPQLFIRAIAYADVVMERLGTSVSLRARAGTGACPYAVFRRSGPPWARSVTIPSLSRFPSESSKKPRQTGGASRRRVRALSRPCRGTLPRRAGESKQAPRLVLGGGAFVTRVPFGARRFRYFFPLAPLGGEGGAKRREMGLFLAEQSDGSFY